MNAIIIAAGSGKRISDDVKNIPKSLLQINGKSLLSYQIDVLNQVGINDIIVIVGPNSEKFDVKNIKYVKDHKHSEHDILGSLYPILLLHLQKILRKFDLKIEL